MDVETILEEQSMDEVLEHLVEFGYLEGAAEGIARKVIAEGTESLSDKQRYVYDKFVKQEYLDVECDCCGAPVPTSEIIGALEFDGGLCSWCAKMKENHDRDD